MIEPTLNAILLRGRGIDVKRTKKLINSLDVDPKVYPKSHAMKYTDVAEVHKTILEIIESKRRTKKDNKSPLTRRLKIAVSEQNNRLIVEGTAEDHAYLNYLILEIDRPMPEGSGGTRTYRLENIQAAEVTTIIQSLIEENQGGSGGSSRSREGKKSSALNK